jgi:hypothetical protein
LNGHQAKEDKSWGLMDWSKFVLISSAVVLGALSGYEFFLAKEESRALDILSKNEPSVNAYRNSDGANLHEIWQHKHNTHSNRQEGHESRGAIFRNVGIGLGGVGLGLVFFDFAF